MEHLLWEQKGDIDDSMGQDFRHLSTRRLADWLMNVYFFWWLLLLLEVSSRNWHAMGLQPFSVHSIGGSFPTET